MKTQIDELNNLPVQTVIKEVVVNPKIKKFAITRILTAYSWYLYKIILSTDFYEICAENKEGKIKHFQVGGEILKPEYFETIKNTFIGDLK